MPPLTHDPTKGVPADFLSRILEDTVRPAAQ